MFELWQHGQSELAGGAASTLAAQLIVPRDEAQRCKSVRPSELEGVFKSYDKMADDREKEAALVVGWYTRFVSDHELLQRAQSLFEEVSESEERVLAELLRHLGVAPEKLEEIRMRRQGRAVIAR